MSNVLEYVARRIRELRLSHAGGLSQEALAKAIKIAPNTVSRWETGVYKPSLDDLDKLSRFFNTSILTFFPQEETATTEKTRALMRAAQTLTPSDLDELQRFAEWRQAQHLLKRIKK